MPESWPGDAGTKPDDVHPYERYATAKFSNRIGENVTPAPFCGGAEFPIIQVRTTKVNRCSIQSKLKYKKLKYMN